jgi:hypothetical protein
MNSKVRLLVSDCKGTGYWVWQCLLDEAYMGKGYYYDCSISDEVEVFATDTCKEDLQTVQRVIDSCLRRGLFDKRLYDEFKVLTSAKMQQTYLDATAERRRKGTVIEFSEDFLLIEIPADSGNITIVPRKKPILPRNNSIVPEKNPQNKVEDNKIKESKVNQTTVGAPAPPAPEKKGRAKVEEETEPFWKQLVAVWFDFGKAKFKVEPSFAGQDPKIFKRIIERLKKRAGAKKVEWSEAEATKRLRLFLESAFSDDWLSKHFLLANLEKQFDVTIQKQGTAGTKGNQARNVDIEYLQERYMDGQLDMKLITSDHFKSLEDLGLVTIDDTIIRKRIKSLTGSNVYSEGALCQDYEAGRQSEAVVKDRENLMRLAVAEYFKTLKSAACG